MNRQREGEGSTAPGERMAGEKAKPRRLSVYHYDGLRRLSLRAPAARLKNVLPGVLDHHSVARRDADAIPPVRGWLPPLPRVAAGAQRQPAGAPGHDPPGSPPHVPDSITHLI